MAKVNFPKNADGFEAIGQVKGTTGVVVATNAQGVQRIILPGDYLYADDVVDLSKIELYTPAEFEAHLLALEAQLLQDIDAEIAAQKAAKLAKLEAEKKKAETSEEEKPIEENDEGTQFTVVEHHSPLFAEGTDGSALSQRIAQILAERLQESLSKKSSDSSDSRLLAQNKGGSDQFFDEGRGREDGGDSGPRIPFVEEFSYEKMKSAYFQGEKAFAAYIESVSKPVDLAAVFQALFDAPDGATMTISWPVHLHSGFLDAKTYTKNELANFLNLNLKELTPGEPIDFVTFGIQTKGGVLSKVASDEDIDLTVSIQAPGEDGQPTVLYQQQLLHVGVDAVANGIEIDKNNIDVSLVEEGPLKGFAIQFAGHFEDADGSESHTISFQFPAGMKVTDWSWIGLEKDGSFQRLSSEWKIDPKTNTISITFADKLAFDAKLVLLNTPANFSKMSINPDALDFQVNVFSKETPTDLESNIKNNQLTQPFNLLDIMVENGRDPLDIPDGWIPTGPGNGETDESGASRLRLAEYNSTTASNYKPIEIDILNPDALNSLPTLGGANNNQIQIILSNIGNQSELPTIIFGQNLDGTYKQYTPQHDAATNTWIYTLPIEAGDPNKLQIIPAFADSHDFTIEVKQGDFSLLTTTNVQVGVMAEAMQPDVDYTFSVNHDSISFYKNGLVSLALDIKVLENGQRDLDGSETQHIKIYLPSITGDTPIVSQWGLQAGAKDWQFGQDASGRYIEYQGTLPTTGTLSLPITLDNATYTALQAGKGSFRIQWETVDRDVDSSAVDRVETTATGMTGGFGDAPRGFVISEIQGTYDEKNTIPVQLGDVFVTLRGLLNSISPKIINEIRKGTVKLSDEVKTGAKTAAEQDIEDINGRLLKIFSALNLDITKTDINGQKSGALTLFDDNGNNLGQGTNGDYDGQVIFKLFQDWLKTGQSPDYAARLQPQAYDNVGFNIDFDIKLGVIDNSVFTPKTFSGLNPVSPTFTTATLEDFSNKISNFNDKVLETRVSIDAVATDVNASLGFTTISTKKYEPVGEELREKTVTESLPLFQIKDDTVKMPIAFKVQAPDRDGSESIVIRMTLPEGNSLLKTDSLGKVTFDWKMLSPSQGWVLGSDGKTIERVVSGEALVFLDKMQALGVDSVKLLGLLQKTTPEIIEHLKNASDLASFKDSIQWEEGRDPIIALINQLGQKGDAVFEAAFNLLHDNGGIEKGLSLFESLEGLKLEGDSLSSTVPLAFDRDMLEHMSYQDMNIGLKTIITDNPNNPFDDTSDNVKIQDKQFSFTYDKRFLDPMISEFSFDPARFGEDELAAAIKSHQVITLDIKEMLLQLDAAYKALKDGATINVNGQSIKLETLQQLETAQKALFDNTKIIFSLDSSKPFPADKLPIAFFDTTQVTLTPGQGLNSLVATGEQLQKLYNSLTRDGNGNLIVEELPSMYVASAPYYDQDFKIGIKSYVDGKLSNQLELLKPTHYVVDSQAQSAYDLGLGDGTRELFISPRMEFKIVQKDNDNKALFDLNGDPQKTAMKAITFTFDVKANFPDIDGSESHFMVVRLDTSKFLYPPFDSEGNPHPKAGQPIGNDPEATSYIFQQENSQWTNAGHGVFYRRVDNNTEADFDETFSFTVPSSMVPIAIQEGHSYQKDKDGNIVKDEAGNPILSEFFGVHYELLSQDRATDFELSRFDNVSQTELDMKVAIETIGIRERTDNRDLTNQQMRDYASDEGQWKVADVSFESALRALWNRYHDILIDLQKQYSPDEIYSVLNNLSANQKSRYEDLLGSKVEIGIGMIEQKHLPKGYFESVDANFTESNGLYTLTGNDLATALIQWNGGKPYTYVDANGQSRTTEPLAPTMFFRSDLYSATDFTVSIKAYGAGETRPFYYPSDVLIIVDGQAQGVNPDKNPAGALAPTGIQTELRALPGAQGKLSGQSDLHVKVNVNMLDTDSSENVTITLNLHGNIPFEKMLLMQATGSQAVWVRDIDQPNIFSATIPAKDVKTIADGFILRGLTSDFMTSQTDAEGNIFVVGQKLTFDMRVVSTEKIADGDYQIHGNDDPNAVITSVSTISTQQMVEGTFNLDSEGTRTTHDYYVDVSEFFKNLQSILDIKYPGGLYEADGTTFKGVVQDFLAGTTLSLGVERMFLVESPPDQRDYELPKLSGLSTENVDSIKLTGNTLAEVFQTWHKTGDASVLFSGNNANPYYINGGLLYRDIDNDPNTTDPIKELKLFNKVDINNVGQEAIEGGQTKTLDLELTKAFQNLIDKYLTPHENETVINLDSLMEIIKSQNLNASGRQNLILNIELPEGFPLKTANLVTHEKLGLGVAGENAFIARENEVAPIQMRGADGKVHTVYQLTGSELETYYQAWLRGDAAGDAFALTFLLDGKVNAANVSLMNGALLDDRGYPTPVAGGAMALNALSDGNKLAALHPEIAKSAIDIKIDIPYEFVKAPTLDATEFKNLGENLYRLSGPEFQAKFQEWIDSGKTGTYSVPINIYQTRDFNLDVTLYDGLGNNRKSSSLYSDAIVQVGARDDILVDAPNRETFNYITEEKTGEDKRVALDLNEAFALLKDKFVSADGKYSQQDILNSKITLTVLGGGIEGGHGPLIVGGGIQKLEGSTNNGIGETWVMTNPDATKNKDGSGNNSVVGGSGEDILNRFETWLKASGTPQEVEAIRKAASKLELQLNSYTDEDISVRYQLTYANTGETVSFRPDQIVVVDAAIQGVANLDLKVSPPDFADGIGRKKSTFIVDYKVSMDFLDKDGSEKYKIVLELYNQSGQLIEIPYKFAASSVQAGWSGGPSGTIFFDSDKINTALNNGHFEKSIQLQFDINDLIAAGYVERSVNGDIKQLNFITNVKVITEETPSDVQIKELAPLEQSLLTSPKKDLAAFKKESQELNTETTVRFSSINEALISKTKISVDSLPPQQHLRDYYESFKEDINPKLKEFNSSNTQTAIINIANIYTKISQESQKLLADDQWLNLKRVIQDLEAYQASGQSLNGMKITLSLGYAGNNPPKIEIHSLKQGEDVQYGITTDGTNKQLLITLDASVLLSIKDKAQPLHIEVSDGTVTTMDVDVANSAGEPIVFNHTANITLPASELTDSINLKAVFEAIKNNHVRLEDADLQITLKTAEVDKSTSPLPPYFILDTSGNGNNVYTIYMKALAKEYNAWLSNPTQNVLVKLPDAIDLSSNLTAKLDYTTSYHDNKVSEVLEFKLAETLTALAPATAPTFADDEDKDGKTIEKIFYPNLSNVIETIFAKVPNMSEKQAGISANTTATKATGINAFILGINGQIDKATDPSSTSNPKDIRAFAEFFKFKVNIGKGDVVIDLMGKEPEFRELAQAYQTVKTSNTHENLTAYQEATNKFFQSVFKNNPTDLAKLQISVVEEWDGHGNLPTFTTPNPSVTLQVQDKLSTNYNQSGDADGIDNIGNWNLNTNSAYKTFYNTNASPVTGTFYSKNNETPSTFTKSEAIFNLETLVTEVLGNLGTDANRFKYVLGDGWAVGKGIEADNAIIHAREAASKPGMPSPAGKQAYVEFYDIFINGNGTNGNGTKLSLKDADVEFTRLARAYKIQEAILNDNTKSPTEKELAKEAFLEESKMFLERVAALNNYTGPSLYDVFANSTDSLGINRIQYGTSMGTSFLPATDGGQWQIMNSYAYRTPITTNLVKSTDYYQTTLDIGKLIQDSGVDQEHGRLMITLPPGAELDAIGKGILKPTDDPTKWMVNFNKAWDADQISGNGNVLDLKINIIKPGTAAETNIAYQIFKTDTITIDEYDAIQAIDGGLGLTYAAVGGKFAFDLQHIFQALKADATFDPRISFKGATLLISETDATRDFPSTSLPKFVTKNPDGSLTIDLNSSDVQLAYQQWSNNKGGPAVLSSFKLDAKLTDVTAKVEYRQTDQDDVLTDEMKNLLTNFNKLVDNNTSLSPENKALWDALYEQYKHYQSGFTKFKVVFESSEEPLDINYLFQEGYAGGVNVQPGQGKAVGNEVVTGWLNGVTAISPPVYTDKGEKVAPITRYAYEIDIDLDKYQAAMEKAIADAEAIATYRNANPSQADQTAEFFNDFAISMVNSLFMPVKEGARISNFSIQAINETDGVDTSSNISLQNALTEYGREMGVDMGEILWDSLVNILERTDGDLALIRGSSITINTGSTPTHLIFGSNQVSQWSQDNPTVIASNARLEVDEQKFATLFGDVKVSVTEPNGTEHNNITIRDLIAKNSSLFAYLKPNEPPLSLVFPYTDTYGRTFPASDTTSTKHKDESNVNDYFIDYHVAYTPNHVISGDMLLSMALRVKEMLLTTQEGEFADIKDAFIAKYLSDFTLQASPQASAAPNTGDKSGFVLNVKTDSSTVKDEDENGNIIASVKERVSDVILPDTLVDIVPSLDKNLDAANSSIKTEIERVYRDVILDESGNVIARSDSAANEGVRSKISFDVDLQFMNRDSTKPHAVVIELPVFFEGGSNINYDWQLLNAAQSGWKLTEVTEQVDGRDVKRILLHQFFDITAAGKITDTIELTFNGTILSDPKLAANFTLRDDFSLYVSSPTGIDPEKDNYFDIKNLKTGLAKVDPTLVPQLIEDRANFVTGAAFSGSALTSGNDTIRVVDGNTSTILSGQGGDDVVYGNAKNNVVIENSSKSGKDYIVAGAGQDMMSTGKGDDIIYAHGQKSSGTLDGGRGYFIYEGDQSDKQQKAAFGVKFEIKRAWWKGGDYYKAYYKSASFDAFPLVRSTHQNMVLDNNSDGTIGKRMTEVTDIIAAGSGNDIIYTHNPDADKYHGALVLAGTGKDIIHSGWGSDVIYLTKANSFKVVTKEPILTQHFWGSADPDMHAGGTVGYTEGMKNLLKAWGLNNYLMGNIGNGNYYNTSSQTWTYDKNSDYSGINGTDQVNRENFTFFNDDDGGNGVFVDNKGAVKNAINTFIAKANEFFGDKYNANLQEIVGNNQYKDALKLLDFMKTTYAREASNVESDQKYTALHLLTSDDGTGETTADVKDSDNEMDIITYDTLSSVVKSPNSIFDAKDFAGQDRSFDTVYGFEQNKDIIDVRGFLNELLAKPAFASYKAQEDKLITDMKAANATREDIAEAVSDARYKNFIKVLNDTQQDVRLEVSNKNHAMEGSKNTVDADDLTVDRTENINSARVIITNNAGNTDPGTTTNSAGMEFRFDLALLVGVTANQLTQDNFLTYTINDLQ